ncbi:Uncharacterised protein [Serratia fonticola]|uniref:Uncharacterized protein n=1 Tax=Serratia fonticola TaxID=47917 RepID=A0A4U9WQ59_SERFO|nr:Uncharacterised protein [Serratia fonticola]
MAFVQFVALGLGQEAKTDHLIERGGAEMAAGHPHQRMNITQATGAALDIRLQVVAGAVIALVALLLLDQLGVKEFGRRPEAVAENVLLQLQEQGDVAADHAGFDQVGGNGQVRQAFQQALFQRAHAVADFQLEIPQQGNEFTDASGLFIGQASLAEHQHVDIRQRVQFTTAIAADGQQRRFGDSVKAVKQPQPPQ